MMTKRIILLSIILLFPFTLRAQDINEELWAAARKGDAVAVKALLARGANVNAKFRYDATALSYAADKGHLEVVKVLLEHGADVNVKDTFYKSTPVIWAALKGHAQIIAALLDKNAEGKDDALMIGADNGNMDVVKTILAKGGVKAETLSQALASATKNNRAEIVEMLKKAGAIEPPKAEFSVDAETLKSYAGTYKNQEGTEVIIALKDGKLTVTAAGQPSATLGAFDKTTFRPLEFEGVTITFSLDNSKVTAFTFKQGSTERVFTKVETK